jgi:hypothetical protein
VESIGENFDQGVEAAPFFPTVQHMVAPGVEYFEMHVLWEPWGQACFLVFAGNHGVRE